MKNLKTLSIVFVVMAGSAIIGCKTPAEKLKNAQDAVIEADSDLVKANQDYLTEMESYKKETDAKIETNQQNLAEFETRMAKEKLEVKAEYAKTIEELRQKNQELKKRLDESSIADEVQWETFKSEFSRDLDELGKSFEDLTVKDKDN